MKKKILKNWEFLNSNFVSVMALSLTNFSIVCLGYGYKSEKIMVKLINFSIFIFIMLINLFLYLIRRKQKRIEHAEKEKYYNLCLKEIKKLEEILKTIPISSFYKQTVVRDFEIDLSFCYYSKDYKKILKDIKNMIYFFEKEKEEFNFEKKQPIKTSSKIVKSLNVLGLSPNIKDFSVMKRRYMELIKEYHPDVNIYNKESEEKAKAVNVAYKTLKKEFC